MRRVALQVALSIAWLATPTARAAPPTSAGLLQQVAGILEYIAGDYRQAVSEQGVVLQPGEYEEQRSLVDEGAALAAQAGLDGQDALRQRLSQLQQAVRDRKPPANIAALCRDARQLIVELHGVALGPEGTPSRDQGARLFAQQGCAGCHGADGSGNTEVAQKLTPRPANFLDPQRMSAVSPHRAFHAISFGVPGTAMQAYSRLPAAERWSLAFYVLSLRHAGTDLAAGKRVFAHSAGTLPSTARGLALLTDEDIARQAPPGASEVERAQLLGYLRVDSSFRAEPEGSANSMQLARRELHAGLSAYRAGDSVGARRHFVSAYLDGFEPHEAAISAHDRALVQSVERTMLALRKAAAQGAARAQLESLVRETDALLMRAEDHRGDGTTALLGALTIALREGLEITLLIGALLGLVRKRGLPELVRYVHAGWVLAAASGLLTFWAVGELLSGLQRELAEGIATLVAALLLLGVTHWLLGQLSAKRFMGFLAARMGEAASRKTALGVLGLTFLAAYREAFEVVLFFKALLLDAGPHRSRVWLGAGIGLLVLALIAAVLNRVGQRLQPRRFMLASSVLLALLVFALAGNGVHALQEAAVLGITPLAFPELPLLGVHATAETLTAQACVLLFLIGSALWPLLRQRPDGISNTGADVKPAGQAR